jgi:hypothetical protein
MQGWQSPFQNLAKANPELEYYELPVLSRFYSPIRWLIDGGMKGCFLDWEARERTITVYTNKRAFRVQLGIKDENTIHVFLLEGSGRLIWRTEGAFNQERLHGLEEAVITASIGSHVKGKPDFITMAHPGITYLRRSPQGLARITILTSVSRITGSLAEEAMKFNTSISAIYPLLVFAK